jgi:hypothetical protein
MDSDTQGPGHRDLVAGDSESESQAASEALGAAPAGRGPEPRPRASAQAARPRAGPAATSVSAALRQGARLPQSRPSRRVVPPGLGLGGAGTRVVLDALIIPPISAQADILCWPVLLARSASRVLRFVGRWNVSYSCSLARNGSVRIEFPLVTIKPL